MRSLSAGRDGFTILELVVVVAFVGLVVAVAAPRMAGLGNELNNASLETAGFFRQVRAEAMTTSSAYRVVVDSDGRLRAERAPRCNASLNEWTVDPRISFNLRDRTRFDGVAADSTLMCFNSRGIGNANPSLRIRERNGGNEASDVEVYLGGGVKITPREAI